VAAWAVALGLFLVLVAGATSRAETGGTSLEPADGGRQTLSEGPRITWYGPGLYGRRTACGERLLRTTQGVAHRRLACGTRVTLYANGRSTTVPIIDRGPRVRGVTWDLTAATARSLRLSRAGRVRLAYIRVAD
jgi:peptidoglycan lytic transglycosylase